MEDTIELELESSREWFHGTQSKADPQSKAEPEEEGASWWNASYLLLGDVLGTGVLGLPYAASQLGWALAIVSLIVFAGCAIYAGKLLCLVRTDFAPNCNSYGEMATELVGPRFGFFTKAAIIFNWGMLLPYFLLATVDSVALVDTGDTVCFWEWGMIVVAVLVPVVQIRRLHGAAILALTATVTVLVALGLTLAKLTHDSTNHFGEGTQAGPQPGVEFLDFYSSFSSFIFAYQGQSIFLEIMSEMKEPSTFSPKSTLGAYIPIFIAYSVCSVVAYGYSGNAVASFLPDGLPNGPIKQTVGVLLAYHIGVAYLITCIPFHREVHAALFPESVGKNTTTARLQWLGISLITLALAYCIGNAIPNFANLQALIGSLTGAPIVFGWPPFFYLYAAYKKDTKVARVDKVICLVFICFCMPVFTILGSIASIKNIVNEASGGVFKCTLE